jgi:LDH2 family malate/lactate/ureidoglycolate dehydrogenase
MRISVQDLTKTAESILVALGASLEESRLVAEGLIRADLRGVPTHGVTFLVKIASRVENGVLDLPTTVTELSRSGATALLDGGNGLGQVAANKAMRTSIDLAREYGVGFVLVRNTNHIGVLASYTQMAAREGMLGICMCNAAAAIAPTGSAEPFMGTNPMSLALPCGDGQPILFDMSTSVVARGKIRRALATGDQIPTGWAIDETGKPTCDPAEAMKGTLLPVGGPKGYALALFIDLICGMLSGSKYGKDVLSFHKPLGPTGVGVMTMAVDIRRFMPLENFHELIKSHATKIRNSKKASGCSRVYLPGEIEAERESVNRTAGVELDAYVVDDIVSLLGRLKLSVPEHLEGELCKK